MLMYILQKERLCEQVIMIITTSIIIIFSLIKVIMYKNIIQFPIHLKIQTLLHLLL